MAETKLFGKRRLTAANGQVQVEPKDVARVAYQLFEARGHAHGCDVEDWFKAEAIVRQRLIGR